MLYELLGFRDAEFPAGLGWHDKIRDGFPQAAVWAISRALEVPPEETAFLVGMGRVTLERSKRKERLTAEVSANLFRIAQAYHRLFALLKDKDIVSNWLRTPRRELGGLTPIVMLNSQPGTELVMEAIGKIKPAKTVERNEQPAEQASEQEDQDERDERDDREDADEADDADGSDD